jgi:hypothetical protein
MDDLLISIFLFSIGVFLVMVMAKRSEKGSFGFYDRIQMYGWGSFFILGSLFVLLRFFGHYFKLYDL